MRTIKKTDPRILAMIVLLFLGVSYSVYKALDSLSGGEASPEYRRSPPGAFAIPQVDTIIDVSMLDDPRLTDSAYEFMNKNSTDISNQVIKGRLTPKTLMSQGMETDAALSATDTISGYQQYLRNAELDPVLGINSAEGSTAVVNRSIDYVLSGSSLTLSLEFTYQQNINNGWSLIGLNLENE